MMTIMMKLGDDDDADAILALLPWRIFLSDSAPIEVITRKYGAKRESGATSIFFLHSHIKSMSFYIN